MNIYVVIENQFPEAELIMICRCDDEDIAVEAYRRLWPNAESHISACILIGTCNEVEPAVLWKNFITEDKLIDHGNTEEESTDQAASTSEGESTD